LFLDISTELLSRGYSIRFRPGGHSMHPTIRDGEVVTVSPVDARMVKRGDILFYRSEHGVIAHRVVRIREEKSAQRVFILRGDASHSCDEPVRAEQVLGRVISVERDGRKIDLTNRRFRLLSAARVRASQIKTKVMGMHDPHSNIKDSPTV
jgi:signal peptidase I